MSAEPQAEDEKFYTARQAVVWLAERNVHISIHSLANWRGAGVNPPAYVQFRPKGRVLYPESELLKLLGKRKTNTGQS